MRRCLQLAKNGIGIASPNPSVGAVLVYNNTIIGEGYTDSYGGKHAEVNAINSVNNCRLLEQSTLYVSLEPCAHYGKTPPCADLIISKKIPKLIIGCADTNPLVAGKGIEKLKKAGCKLSLGVLEEECKLYHKRFFTVHNKKRPYIILKWAETKDAFIAPEKKSKQKPIWISNTYSQQLVHKWRSEEQAILVGSNTVEQDNPALNVRSWYGKNPVKIIIDRKLRINSSYKVLNNTEKTIVITELEQNNKAFIFYEKIDTSADTTKQLCDILMKHNIQSVIIEGGAQILQLFIDKNTWDEARVFTGDKMFYKGIKAPNIKAKQITEKQIHNNVLKIYTND